ncbi:hypothetical protein KBA84_06980 [Patescibacteria group bacterium]|nr:hypothetical protein [Patescibacteria group bacterium]
MQRDSSDYKKVINRLRQYKPRTTHEYDLLYQLYELGIKKIDLILAGHIIKQH